MNKIIKTKKMLLVSCATLMMVGCGTKKEGESMQTEKNPMVKLDYPNTATVAQKDTYFGAEIEDPYRWLEVDTAAKVEEWVKEQNKVTSSFLEKIPYREAIRKRYEELYNYPKLSSPFKAGEYYFFYKNDGLQNQAVIYIQKGLNGTPEVFIDPNAMSKEGTTAVNLLGISQNDKYVTYSVQEAGSDWQKLYVMDIATKKKLSDQIEWAKFSGASWRGEDGFFYSRYPAPAKGQEFSGNNRFHSVYYHKLGTPQSQDKLVYEDKKNANMYHFGNVSEDGRYFFMYAAPGTNGYATYYKDLQKDAPFKMLFEGYDNKSSVIHNIGERLFVLTDVGAPKYRLIEVDVNKPTKEHWKNIIPEKADLLEGVSSGGGKFFANYLKDATTRIYQYDYEGKNEVEIKLPGKGSAGGFSGKEKDDLLFYSFTSFVYPGTIFKYDVKTGQSSEFHKTQLKFDPADYVEKQVFYTSKDGTKVPMFIVHHKNTKLDGNNPTYLYAYGGFNISLTPSFGASRILLLENGGIFAMPNLRGGGEYGEDWHKGGMQLKKQNVFDDFIAAAEYLIKEKYTNKDKLAIAGGSNGGLLVGACMTQRPDLYAVTFPAVGVMDMLRYHKFTVGKGWIPEYGCADSSEVHFKNLLSYSPLHNLKAGTNYPATMITTADHDDRVVPAHSFKFAAALQKAQTGDRPTVIRIETNAGHGAGKPTSKIIEEQADIWSFFFYNTHSPVKYKVAN